MFRTLPIELGKELLLELPGGKVRIKGSLTGMEPGQFILVKLTAEDIAVFQGESVRKGGITVQFQADHGIYFFTASMLNLLVTPACLLFLSYPEKLEELKPLTEERRKCAINASTMLNNVIVDLVVIDLSPEGCQCVIKTAPREHEAMSKLVQVDKVLNISIHAPDTRENIMLSAMIRNMRRDVDRIKIGMMFVKVSQESRGKLERIIGSITPPKEKPEPAASFGGDDLDKALSAFDAKF